MTAMRVAATAAVLVLLTQVPAWSRVIGIPVKHHIYGRTIKANIIRPGYPKVHGIIIVHPGPKGVPVNQPAAK